MSTVLSLTLPFFGLIFLGFMAAKFFRKEQPSGDWLTIFVVYFTVPALLFSLLSKAPIEELGNMTFMVATTGSTLLVFILVFLLANFRHKKGIAATSLQAAAGSYSNCGYLGVPLSVAAFGSGAAIPATLIVCFDSLLIFLLVPVFIALGRSDRPEIGTVLSDIVNRIVFNPLILGCVAGILAAYFEFMPPGPINRVIEYLSTAAAPCALFALGVTVGSRSVERSSAGVSTNIFFKLIVHPLVLLCVLLLVGITGVWLKTAVLIASLPTALGVYVIANQAQVETQNVSSTILYSTVISLITITSILYIFELGFLPE